MHRRSRRLWTRSSITATWLLCTLSHTLRSEKIEHKGNDKPSHHDIKCGMTVSSRVVTLWSRKFLQALVIRAVALWISQQGNKSSHSTFMTTYTFARIKRITSSAVHISRYAYFSRLYFAFRQEHWSRYYRHTAFRLLASAMWDFSWSRFIARQWPESQQKQNTSVLARSTRKY